MKYYTLSHNLELKDISIEVVSERKQLQLHLYTLVFSFVVLLFIFAFTAIKFDQEQSSRDREIEDLKQSILHLNQSDSLDYNLKSVESYIESIPFKDKDLIKRQMRLESGNTLSSVARSNNNVFGMRNAGKRPQLGIKGDYRNYIHWTQSVMDRYLYELYFGTGLKGYAQDDKYFQKIKR